MQETDFPNEWSVKIALPWTTVIIYNMTFATIDKLDSSIKESPVINCIMLLTKQKWTEMNCWLSGGYTGYMQGSDDRFSADEEVNDAAQ